MSKISIEGKKFVEADVYPNVDKLAIISIFNDNPDETKIYISFSQLGEKGDFLGIIKNDANQEKAISSVISAQAVYSWGILYQSMQRARIYLELPSTSKCL
ncbi:hypothetical protein CN878_08340 [Ochrobactrum sp. 695/2009]|nr:hypothetical protein [Brucella intermedia]PJR94698.1 hypothetical protein CN881_03675 [Ochrobactrum sp. 721/2009]PJT17983.1 hypothetical protein CN880_05140 [Ochrobactrum sp. 720/2009]PJT20884.1 hypothetical protein CN879_15415 [Ochrobactrum sp. 715/2009]PJT31317.1 hypothetical protein CN878_08340 [Ochrobactrum sp. 695/2009]PJT33343.1 hypothetical protein CN877_18345 [Ochrobactrum sp. 689/2009]